MKRWNAKDDLNLGTGHSEVFGKDCFMGGKEEEEDR